VVDVYGTKRPDKSAANRKERERKGLEDDVARKKWVRCVDRFTRKGRQGLSYWKPYEGLFLAVSV
jgi:hypothetical protein